MNPSEKQLNTLILFNRWVRELFGKAKPCFSSKPHREVNGLLSINRGQMSLEIAENSIRLIDKSRGSNIVVCAGAITLEEALMSGLTWAIRQKFCDTFIQ